MKSKISSKRVVTTSLVVDISDILLNGVVALVTGSAVMLAEALQGLADLVTVIFLYIGVKRSARRPNRIYNFGYGRELYFWVMCAAIAMFIVTAGLSFFSGYEKFTNLEPVENTFWAYVTLTIGLVSNLYALSVSIRKIGSTQTKASIIKNFADSQLVEVKTAFITDLMGSISATLGLISMGVYTLTGDPRFDGLGAMVIGVSIAIFALILISETKNMIIGKSASTKDIALIRQAVLDDSRIKKILNLMTTYFGSEELYVNLNIHVDRDLNTQQIENLIDKIERNIKKVKPEVDLVQVEIDG